MKLRNRGGEVDAVAVDPVGRAFSNKRNPGKVPRKIHKAEREKLKRDHLNELFVELDNALVQCHPPNVLVDFDADESESLVGEEIGEGIGDGATAEDLEDEAAPVHTELEDGDTMVGGPPVLHVEANQET
ncbi:Transcription factor bHLH47 [Acorus calamus]|uniref:Transcription factor bHLH47 n=1 Tax=Acorus calamus TaxID=4465 RepID=A0AAV9DPP0_ACOCL|nr:Transcription factor bHLH47 [Acorus calamus]